ncbi:hypothetical protein [Natroniella sp. ANB-PHB2]|uniref:hypothetical protein n=1 Tax=Natroniella sp. ANB-PHB2 TaxID=3384444 RepID=UPI0038D37D74
MKKISILLTLALVIGLAVPALAVEGEVTSKVDFDGDNVSFTYADGEATLVDEDALSLGLTFLANDAADNTFKLGSTLEYTEVANLTAGFEGALEDDYMFAKLGTEDDTRVGLELFANYEDELEAVTFGANNDLNVKNVEENDDDDEVLREGAEFVSVLTINPFVNYEEVVAPGFTVGVNNDVATTVTDFDFDTLANKLTVNPYANYEVVVAEGVTAGVNNEFTFETLDDNEKQELVVKPFANFDFSEEELTLTVDNHIETTRDFASAEEEEFETVLVIAPKVEYTAIDNLTLGVAGDLDDDNEMIIINDLVGFDNIDIAAKSYANYNVEIAPGLTAGVDNSIVTEREDAEEFTNTVTVKPNAEYEEELTSDLDLFANTSYELSSELDELGDLFDEGDFEVTVGVTYNF